jgi:small subunit ribosomal protein S6
MNKYELIYIIDAHATQAVKDEIAKQVSDALAKSGIKLVNTQIWLERHKMSFAINKLWEGTYYLLNIEAPPEAIEKLHVILRINEQILRYLTVRQEAEQPLVAATAAK